MYIVKSKMRVGILLGALNDWRDVRMGKWLMAGASTRTHLLKIILQSHVYWAQGLADSTRFTWWKQLLLLENRRFIVPAESCKAFSVSYKFKTKNQYEESLSSSWVHSTPEIIFRSCFWSFPTSVPMNFHSFPKKNNLPRRDLQIRDFNKLQAFVKTQ
jgi:hypothetical protein